MASHLGTGSYVHTGLSGPGVTCHLPVPLCPLSLRTAYRGADCSCERRGEGMTAGLLTAGDLVSTASPPTPGPQALPVIPPGSFCAPGLPSTPCSQPGLCFRQLHFPPHLSLPLRRPAGSPPPPLPCATLADIAHPSH